MQVRLSSITFQETPMGTNAPATFIYTFMPVAAQNGAPMYTSTAIQIAFDSADRYVPGQVYELVINSVE
jgi:hypothetical protein